MQFIHEVPKKTFINILCNIFFLWMFYMCFCHPRTKHRIIIIFQVYVYTSHLYS